MNKNRSSIGVENNWLIDSVIDDIFKEDKFDLQDIVIVFPTKRLAYYLLAKLALLYNKAFFPPQIYTLESFIKTWSSKFYVHIGRIVYEDELLSILFYLIEQNKFLYIHHGLEKELLFLFLEIYINHNHDEVFDKLNQSVINSIQYHNEIYIKNLINKFEEVKELYTVFIQFLKCNNLIPNQKYLLECAQIIYDHHKDSRLLLYCSHAYFIGFTDIQEFLMPLLVLLSSKTNVKFKFNSYLQLLFTRKNTLEELIQTINHSSNNHNTLIKSTDIVGNIKIFAYPTVLQEILHTTNKVKLLIQKGILPSAIGIVVLNPEEYLKPLVEMMEVLDIKFNISIPMQLKDTIEGNWILSFINFVSNIDETTFFVDWFLHSITLQYLQQNINEFKDFTLYQIKSYLLGEIYKTQAGCGFKHIINTTQDPLMLNVLHNIYKTIEFFLNSKQASFKSFMNNFITFINIYLSNNKLSNKNIKINVLSDILDYLAGIDFTDLNCDLQVSGFTFLKFLESFLLTHKVYIPSNSLEGVQILSLKEARNFPFLFLYVLGCSEKNLPCSISYDNIIEDFLKRDLGLKTKDQLDIIEETSFCVLLSSKCDIELSYSKISAVNQVQYKSKLLQILITRYNIREHEICFKSADIVTSDINYDELHNCNIYKEGNIYNLIENKCYRLMTHNLSPMHLENLIICPYKFILSKFGITSFKLPSSALDARQEGQWLHKVLELVLKNWPISSNKEDILKFLFDITVNHMPSAVRIKDTLFQLQFYSWPKFVEHILTLYSELDMYDFNPQKGLREFNIKSNLDELFVLHYNDIQIEPVGIIDSVDFIDDNIIIITDYKTSRIPNPSKFKQGIYPQLLFYGLCLLHHPILKSKNLNLDKIVLGYWNIKKAQWIVVACGSDAAEILKSKFNKRKISDIKVIINKMWDNVVWRIDSIINQYKRFYADPSICSYDSSYFCSFSSICRKDDPNWYRQIHNQCMLKIKIDGDKNGSGS